MPLGCDPGSFLGVPLVSGPRYPPPWSGPGYPSQARIGVPPPREGKVQELEGVTEQDFGEGNLVGEKYWVVMMGDLKIELIRGGVLLGDCQGIEF